MMRMQGDVRCAAGLTAVEQVQLAVVDRQCRAMRLASVVLACATQPHAASSAAKVNPSGKLQLACSC